MDLLTFIYGIMITIISVVTVESFLHYIREKNERHKLITSLNLEVASNIDLVDTNLNLLKDGTKSEYITFVTIVYSKFRQSISLKLIKLLGTKNMKSLLLGYIYCEEFNRKIAFTGENFDDFKRTSLEYIKENFDSYYNDIGKIRIK